MNDAEVPGVGTGGWLQTFEAFGVVHAAIVVLATLSMVGSCWLGRRWKDTPAERRFRGWWVLFTVVVQSVAVVWYLLQFDLQASLPLHVCDVAAWLAPLALWFQKRWLRDLLYFWGIGLSTQAFLTPVLREGAGDLQFWFFWVGHLQIVGSAVYDAAVLGYRPDWRSLRTACLSISVYGVLMIFFNIALGTNYAYVGDVETEQRTIIDALGAWPGRLVWLFLLANLALMLAWAPWAILRRRAGPRDPNTLGG